MNPKYAKPRRGFYAYRGGVWVQTTDPRAEILTRHHRRKIYIRTLELMMYVAKDGSRTVIPSGFVCDGGSKPNWSWWLFGHPLGRYLVSYILHDWLYDLIREAIRGGMSTSEASGKRRDADKLWRECMEWVKQQHDFGRARNRWHRIKNKLNIALFGLLAANGAVLLRRNYRNNSNLCNRKK